MYPLRLHHEARPHTQHRWQRLAAAGEQHEGVAQTQSNGFAANDAAKAHVGITRRLPAAFVCSGVLSCVLWCVRVRECVGARVRASEKRRLPKATKVALEVHRNQTRQDGRPVLRHHRHRRTARTRPNSFAITVLTLSSCPSRYSTSQSIEFRVASSDVACSSSCALSPLPRAASGCEARSEAWPGNERACMFQK